MGLDMYLIGDRFNWTDWKKPEGQRRPMVDGYEVSTQKLDLGYWRKHPDLHGYIVNTFANGKDECQEIDLSEKNLLNIIEAIKENKLPKTTGFFFGESDGTEKNKSILIIEKAIEWLKKEEPNVAKSISYRASW
jgi:hypothetical protein